MTRLPYGQVVTTIITAGRGRGCSGTAARGLPACKRELTGGFGRATPSPSPHSAAPGTVEKPCRPSQVEQIRPQRLYMDVLSERDSVLTEAPVLQEKDRRE